MGASRPVRSALPEAPVVTPSPDVAFEISPRVLLAWNAGLRASDESDSDNHISILEPIGEDGWTGQGVTARRVAAALRKIGAGQTVVVNINSPGGDYFEGLAIYNLLRAHEGEVRIRILGVAASAASVIAMAGDTVEIGKAAFLMIHNAWIVAAGNRHDLREAADWIEPFDRVAAEIYAARTGLAVADLEQMLNDESWIDGTRALDLGFADEYLAADVVTKQTETLPEPQGSARERLAAEMVARIAEGELTTLSAALAQTLSTP
ncbi:head maturation protease, ClpP-related [Orrella sp. 11846]|uniref:head maturation protease, ClpP-related n=1 Tax=Orrella sp. 11846 TaxID=3409913 RepID=UPI003B5A2F29